MSPLLNFLVHVGELELVRPETTTPREFKYLSNIDVQTDLRNHLPLVHFFPPNKALPAQDPVVMIKQALAKVLIHYYPGRLRNTTERGKLVVEYCGEGVVFQSGRWTEATIPVVSYPQPEYNAPLLSTITFTQTDFQRLAQTSIFFSNSEISSALKNQLNGHNFQNSCSGFMSTSHLVDTWFQYKPSLPKGFYGNAMVFPCAIAKEDDLTGKPLQYAARLIFEAKRGVMGDNYRASVLDLIEVNEGGGLCMEGANVIADLSHLRFRNIDFGYGPGAYGGMARAGTGPAPGLLTPIVGHKNEEGVEGVLALASLPLESVDRFHMEERKQIHSAIHLKPFSAL
ncbi:hypothetical protein PVL29_018584 [Vitis rotundifolia]|uniref:Uncharacterized protein n=1 Tax=Vitis rotundifolia TaxID=103349 RepID=A0AA39DF66_VITRO|nr:hypothetical protein PVL29_018584 [Vitis rotundifolia]